MELTAIEKRIVAVLADGMRHNRDELRLAMSEDANLNALAANIFRIRPKLRAKGEDIICEYYHKRFYYRHVRLIASNNE